VIEAQQGRVARFCAALLCFPAVARRPRIPTLPQARCKTINPIFRSIIITLPDVRRGGRKDGLASSVSGGLRLDCVAEMGQG
jgi:hypothetical protein